jgi:murein L,D-transpeptidase YcbB/YkuD
MVASGEYADRVWPPGPRNPLGLAAVRLEPGLLVYLHDTNQRQLFEREIRALSHGCIRVERWEELVGFVLDMDLEEVRRIANGRRTLEVPAAPIPVTLGYFTAFPDENGELRRFEDIYRRGTGTDEVSRAAVGCAGGAAE